MASQLIATISFSTPPSWYLCSVVFRVMGKKKSLSEWLLNDPEQRL